MRIVMWTAGVLVISRMFGFEMLYIWSRRRCDSLAPWLGFEL
jgi:hypothetical protein